MRRGAKTILGTLAGVLGLWFMFWVSGDLDPKPSYIPFPKSRILTCSVEDYCLSIGKNPRDYYAVGFSEAIDPDITKFLPPGTEVVVDYRCSAIVNGCGDHFTNQYGTALVPKRLENIIKK